MKAEPERSMVSPLCLGCDYSLKGLDAQRCPECGRAFDQSRTDTFNASGRPIGWIRRRILIANPCPAWAVALVILSSQLWTLRSPERAMRATWVFDWTALCLMAVGVRAGQLMLRRLVAEPFGRSVRSLRSRLPSWPLYLLLIPVTTYAASSRWPMKLSFHVSREALDQIADRALANPLSVASLAGRPIGPFIIDEVEILKEGVVAIYVHRQGWSSWGFARMPGYAAEWRDAEELEPTGKLRLQRLKRIADDWFILYDRYWASKLGPS